MKIGYEAKRVFKNFTGLGNYSRSVVQTLAEAFPQDSFYLYTPKAPASKRLDFLKTLKNVFVHTPTNKNFQPFWRSFGLAKDAQQDGIELFHGLSHEIPFGLKSKKIKSVVTIHDLIFLRYPQYFKFIDRQIYSFKFKYACKNADTIIAISEQTKRDIIHYFGTNEQKIKVVYQGCDPIFYEPTSTEKLAQIRQTYQLPDKFLLCVGTIENRKNQLLIIKALKHLANDVQLVLVGKPTLYKKELINYISVNHLEKRVSFVENIPFQDLPAIYNLAKIFVYPSFFEGFGIPILEALNCGVPVIAAKGSCLEEAGGNSSIYINPHKEEELAHQINLILNDSLLIEKMIADGKKFALNFRANIIAKNMMEVYKNTLSAC
jgi:glycosyltransferase involved in cell wall biosynthesis